MFFHRLSTEYNERLHVQRIYAAIGLTYSQHSLKQDAFIQRKREGERERKKKARQFFLFYKKVGIYHAKLIKGHDISGATVENDATL